MSTGDSEKVTTAVRGRTYGGIGHAWGVDQAQSAVAYDGLPVSSGGAHGLGRVSAREALASWYAFLAACTRPGPISCFFDTPKTPDIRVDRRTVKRIKREFERTPGWAGRRFDVPTDRIDDAVALFESLEPLPTNPWGMAPVWLSIVCDFRLLDPNRSGLWPGQDPQRFGGFRTPAGVQLGASATVLNMQARRSLGLALSIPDAGDEDLASIVPWLQAALPMRLSAKQWTRWTLTKSGASYRGKRISVPGLS